MVFPGFSPFFYHCKNMTKINNFRTILAPRQFPPQDGGNASTKKKNTKKKKKKKKKKNLLFVLN